jgi:hypothetical protein
MEDIGVSLFGMEKDDRDNEDEMQRNIVQINNVEFFLIKRWTGS